MSVKEKYDAFQKSIIENLPENSNKWKALLTLEEVMKHVAGCFIIAGKENSNE